MKIRFNNDSIKRIVSKDGSCTRCLFDDGTASCKLLLIDLCATKNICYTLHLSKFDDSIFSI